MWWIAACLGALVWLLALRIRLKEKEREAQHVERQKGTAKAARTAFLEGGFAPVATQYLQQVPEANALVLLFAHLEWSHKPAEVHMEVVPVTQLEATAQQTTAQRTGAQQTAALAAYGLWVTKDGEGWHFSPPQAHWERLAGLEGWLPKLECFADVAEPVPAEQATLGSYRAYAIAKRAGDTVAVEVVGEPN
jgi:hypothetical protein